MAPSNRKMREEIDWTVDMLSQLVTKPYEMQLEVLSVFKETGLATGNRELMERLTNMMGLPPEELIQAIGMLRGQLLVIKHDQFGG